MRQLGYVLLISLVLLCFALEQRSSWRAQRLLHGEELAAQRIEQLHKLAKAVVRSGQPAELAELIAAPELSSLTMLEELSKTGMAFAHDEVYVYGMAQTTQALGAGSGPRYGFILRAWPIDFGVTGDLEFHIDSKGNAFHGQNTKGRSGVTIDFPPAFPAADVGSRRSGWWRVKLADRN